MKIDKKVIKKGLVELAQVMCDNDYIYYSNIDCVGQLDSAKKYALKNFMDSPPNSCYFKLGDGYDVVCQTKVFYSLLLAETI